MTGIPFRAYADLDLVSAAHAVARVLHHGQVDKAGRPYFGHVRDVARRLSEMNQPAELVAAGFLHDTVEDGHTTFVALVAVFPLSTVAAVRAVTRDKDAETYDEFLTRIIAAGRDAMYVKLADLDSNLSPERADGLTVPLALRYERARRILITTLGEKR